MSRITTEDHIGSKTLLFIFLMELKIKNKTGNAEFKISGIDENDKETFELFHRGDTKGIFSFESPEMQECLKKLNSICMKDLYVLKVLYIYKLYNRDCGVPELDNYNIPEFIERKNHPDYIKYPLPCLEEILKETCGMTIYHEQIIQIAKKIAGFSFEEADLLRRDLGKKKADVIIARKKQFEDGAVKKGYNIKNADEIFDLLFSISCFTFPKSYIEACSKLDYQTAWLKCHYPEEFSCLYDEMKYRGK